jgi:uncharacterized membrane protein YoaK (UPF0700 family)
MLAKLPPWALVGGGVLAGIAGMVNTVGFLSFTHQGVTHLTGTTTLLSVALFEPGWRPALHLAALIGAFVAGATLSGFAIEHSVLRLGRRYGVILMIEAALLGAAAYLMKSNVAAGSYLASMACGAQNAMASSYSGTVLRTTHLTGMFTDLGVVLGHWLRGVAADWKRFQLCANLIVAFIAGGAAGNLLFQKWGPQALYFPAAFTGCVGLGYSVYAHFRRPGTR